MPPSAVTTPGNVHHQLAIYKNTAQGVATRLAAAPVTWVPGHVLRFQVQGDKLNVFQNSTETLVHNDTNVITAGAFVGIERSARSNAATIRLDNFLARAAVVITPIPSGSPYVLIRWQEVPVSDAAATPTSAANLNHMELGIMRTHARPMTMAEQDALMREDLFTGRTIFNRNVERLEVYTATPPVSPAGFNTPGWFRIPTFHDVMKTEAIPQTILGIKTFAQPIIACTRFVGAKTFLPNTRAITGNTFVKLAWDGEDFDTSDISNPIADPTRMIMPFPGHYEISCSLRWTNGAAGPFDINIRGTNGILHHVDVLSADANALFEVTRAQQLPCYYRSAISSRYMLELGDLT